MTTPLVDDPLPTPAPPAERRSPAPETVAVRAGARGAGQSLAPALWSTSAFEVDPVETRRLATTPRTERFYSRHGNPAVRQFEEAMAELEGAEAALAFASGMGAICAVVLGLCARGNHVVAQRQMYGGTLQLLRRICPRFGIEVTLVDATRPGAFAEAVRPGRTVLVLAETPANPRLDLVDLDELGAIQGPITVVDSTFATPAGPAAPRPRHRPRRSTPPPRRMAGHNDATLGVVVRQRRPDRLAVGLRRAAGGERLAVRRHQRATRPAHAGRPAAPAEPPPPWPWPGRSRPTRPWPTSATPASTPIRRPSWPGGSCARRAGC